VGRKNHYGSKSLRGTQVAALFYTLWESAKLADVDPHLYPLTATEAALVVPGTVTLPAAVTA
jgi:transposase